MRLSIVATLYGSEPYIDEFIRRCGAAARQIVGEDYEVILVNDGSPDGSLELALRRATEDGHLVIVDLSRNFGHHKAMLVGLEQAAGERIFLIDSDLEEEPEWLIAFSEVLEKDRVDVVYGRQRRRRGGRWERWTGALYYSLLRWLTDLDHPRDIVTARLMSRRYVKALLLYRERELVISCLWIITGFAQVGMLVDKHSSSRTTYRASRKLYHAINAIISFSEVPLRIIFYVGLLITALAGAYATRLAIMRLLYSQTLPGWTSVMLSVWVLGGLVISILGIIGIYLSKVFIEVKQRPNAIIREIYRPGAAAR